MNLETNRKRDWVLMSLIVVAFFAAIGPTLSWLEFSSGSENLVVATALETRRTGRRLLPTMLGQPRLAKPPLTAWISAATIRPDTFAKLTHSDAAVRAQGYWRLAWEVRWPALLATCITLAGVYELGRMVVSWRAGLLAAVICGTNYAFLRFGRYATTDVQLALWVTLANVFIAYAVFEGRRWVGAIGAGAALGLAFMSKGPVALAQTVIPLAGFVIWRSAMGHSDRGTRKPVVVPVLIGLLVMLAIAAPWFMYVASQFSAWKLWFVEVTRNGATALEESPWYSYLSLFAMLLPWSIFLVGGLIATVPLVVRRGNEPAMARLVYCLFLLIVPILVMSFFRDRKERYLLPMFGPAAVLSAYAILAMGRRPLDKLASAAHWVILVIAGVSGPLVCATRYVPQAAHLGGQPWLTWPVAVAMAGAGGALLVAVYALVRQPQARLTVATVLLMLLVQAEFAWGYARDEQGASQARELAEIIHERLPGAAVYNFNPARRTNIDLAIYLNQTVWGVESLGEIPAGGSQVLVWGQGRREPPPPPELDGWKPLTTIKRAKVTFHTYYRGQ